MAYTENNTEASFGSQEQFEALAQGKLRQAAMGAFINTLKAEAGSFHRSRTRWASGVGSAPTTQ
jgi:hypothetical protein